MVTHFFWHFKEYLLIFVGINFLCTVIPIIVIAFDFLVVWCSNKNKFFLYSNSDCQCFLVRKLSHEEYFKNGEGSVLRDGHIHICSENNFPTAAGLASSAAGYSCLGILADNFSFHFISWGQLVISYKWPQFWPFNAIKWLCWTFNKCTTST